MVIRNGIISLMLASLVAVVCLFAAAAPVSAGINVTIDPCRSLPGALPGYTCVLNYSDTCGIYFVNVTIPEGYAAKDTVDCNCSEIILTLRNESTGEIISKSVAFNNDSGYWVNVTETAYDDVYGPFIANCSEGDVTNICMGSTSCLRLTMPTASANGSINISLGALGPLTSGDNMTLQFASDCIKNPETSGRYTWLVTTDDTCGYSDLGVVCIMHPGDIDGNDHVYLSDLMELADAFNSHPGDPNWNQCADLDCNGHIYLSDLMMLADNFNEYY
jgi:hypothetical protein